MILGYIVTDRKLNGINGFVEQVNSIEQADSTKPILIVGWKNAKKYEGYTSILNKQLSDNVYWTFSRSESRSEQEEDLKKFYKLIINNILTYLLSDFLKNMIIKGNIMIAIILMIKKKTKLKLLSHIFIPPFI